jgi:hypothetical protein
MDVVRERLRNQRLVGAESATAHEVVRWLGAVQAQDYGAAKWAIAQRAGELTSTDLDKELAASTILRTHVLRPTWHFVTPQDIRWMLALTAPRMRATMEYGNRQSGLTESVIERAIDVIVGALTSGRRLMRSELAHRLVDAGIRTGDPLGLGRVLHRAEVEGVICSGGLRGKQQTYALLEELVPRVKALDHEAALSALASRYFASHGPATMKDFVWWSGLSAADARTAMHAAEPALEQILVGELSYWRSEKRQRQPPLSRGDSHLLTNFDEYTVGYADRRSLLEEAHQNRGAPSTLLGNTVVVNGLVLGTWKRILNKSAVHITLNLFRPLTKDEGVAVEMAADRYGRFLDLAVDVDHGSVKRQRRPT